MPRPRKCRRVCHFPETVAFGPVESVGNGPEVILNVDEYETIRLIDREGMSQEQCCEQMGIARTTVQLIYAQARKSWRTRWWRDESCALRAAIIGSVTVGMPAVVLTPVSNRNSINCFRHRKEIIP